jgi:hypothetical protein
MTDEKNVGYYVGLITSCFALTQLMTGNYDKQIHKR